MTAPRHRWTRHSGLPLRVVDSKVEPDTEIRRCTLCGVYTRTKVVTTSRIGVHSATIANRDVPTYSRDEKRWSCLKPVCAGKATP